MADVYVSTTGSDANGGTSIVDAYATIGIAVGDAEAGDTIWCVVSNDGDQFTSETATVAFATAGTDGAGPVHVRGTNASGAVDGTMAIFNFTGVTVATGGFDIQVAHLYFENISVENVDTGSSLDGFRLQQGLTTNNHTQFLRCAARNCSALGFACDHRYGLFIQCYAGDNGGGGFSIKGQLNQAAYGCVSEYNTGIGFWCGAGASVYMCVSNDNSSHGFVDPIYCVNCTSYNNGGDGIKCQGQSMFRTYINNLIVNSGGYGINHSAGGATNRAGKILMNNAFYNNSSGNYNGIFLADREFTENEEIILAANPFNRADYGDFSLNNVPGGGYLCRAAGLNYVGQHTNTLSFFDIGAVQSTLRAIVAG